MHSNPALPALLLLGLLSGCADSQGPADPGPIPPPSLPPTPFVVSDPVAASPGGPAASYVSLSPGAFAAAAVTLHVVRTGATVNVNLVDGGFDPVPVAAVAGDTIVAVVPGSAGSSSYTLLVPGSASPVVVRTTPLDHQLNVAPTDTIEVAFSEPMDRSTLGGAFALTKGGAPVSGTIRLLPDTGLVLRASFVPADTLAPLSIHQIRIGRGARDLGGDSLRTSFLADFSTDTLATPIPPPPQPPVVTIFTPRSGDSVPYEFPQFHFRVTSDAGLEHLGLLLIDETGVDPPFEFTGVDGDLSWLLGRPLDFNSYPPWLGPSTYSIQMTVSDTAGRIGVSDTLQITFVEPDTQPRVIVRSFSVTEFEFAPGSGYWGYAPQLVVAEAPGGGGLQVVGFEILTVPGLQSPFPRAFAYGVSVPEGQDTPLFVEVFGEYEFYSFAADGHRATGTEATVKLTFRDISGHIYASTITGPIITGTPPTTYTPGCGHWAGPGLLSYYCPSPVRQEAGAPPPFVYRGLP